MKHIFTFIILLIFVSASYADTYYDATIVFIDGKSKSGLVESTLGTDFILFKSSENVKAEKIESSTVSKVLFKIKNEIREWHFRKVYLGWGQKRISGPMWLSVIVNGIATLYVNKSSVSTPSNSMNSAGFLDYYCIREGEPAAKWVSAVSTLNNNQHFRDKAPLYFADYPELAQKIKSKEYTWKDLEIVVQEYNKWATKKK